MKVQCFFIPIQDRQNVTKTVNTFMADHCVVTVNRELVQNGANSGWSFCIEYHDDTGKPETAGKNRIDYREVLSEPEFTVYAKIRALRKQISAKEHIPAYSVFNNQQLAAMVQRRVTTEQGLREISGIGQSRLSKYSGSFLAVLQVEVPRLISLIQPSNHETQSR